MLQKGYCCATFMMLPISCTPKNDVIVGVSSTALESLKARWVVPGDRGDEHAGSADDSILNVSRFTTAEGRTALDLWLAQSLR